jgi:hypothetical protein
MPIKNKTITKICVKGYKSFLNEQSVEIRPLTILAGANSSGKSSIMQPVLLLKQTLEATSDPGALLIDGPNISFTRAEQMLNRIPGQPSSSCFTVGLQLGDKGLSLTYTKQQGKAIEIESMRYSDGNTSYVMRYGMSEDDILKNVPNEYKQLLKHLKVPERVSHLRWRVQRERCFLVFSFGSQTRPSYQFNLYGLNPSNQFIKPIKNIIHLPALRGNPKRTYQKLSVGPDYPGTFEKYAASIVADWADTKDKRLSELGETLEEMGLTWKVRAKSIDDTQIELKIARLVRAIRGSASDFVNIADVGFGVSQSLPVIVALLCAQQGQLVYLEQPELHLHPKAQRRLGRILREAIERGATVVTETHSELLLREVQILVAKRELDPKKVILHWFSRDLSTGITTVSSADLDDRGAYGKWPEDFDDTALASTKEYLDAVESRG